MQTIKANARRKFLRAASLGGAGVVVAASAAHLAVHTAPATPTAEVEKWTYRASPHILKYYKTAEL